jgi:hypothetical protein
MPSGMRQSQRPPNLSTSIFLGQLLVPFTNRLESLIDLLFG